MGGLSGFDLQERLAATDSPMTVIFITAHDDAPTRERARKAARSLTPQSPSRGTC